MIEMRENVEYDGYDFYYVDENGTEWELGDVRWMVQDEGTEDEYRWLEGRLDTREITAEDEDELIECILRRKQNYDVVLVKADGHRIYY